MGEGSAVQGNASGATIPTGAETHSIAAQPLSAAAQPLSADELRRMDAYWRACNYCCVGMLYLQANPLLREPLQVEHI
jgi:phosphoketolase